MRRPTVRLPIFAVALAASTACSRLPFRAAEPAPPPAAPVAVADTLRWSAPPPEAVVLDDARVERLLTLARTWTVVRWFHPAVAADPLRWEVAYLEAAGAALAADGDAAFPDVVRQMLGRLGDPDTRLVTGPAAVDDRAAARRGCAASDTTPAPRAPDGVLDLRGDPTRCALGGDPAAPVRRRVPAASTLAHVTSSAFARALRADTTTRWRLQRAGLLSSPARFDGPVRGADGLLLWEVAALAPAPVADGVVAPAADTAGVATVESLPLIVVVDAETSLSPEIVRTPSAQPLHIDIGAAQRMRAVYVVLAGDTPPTTPLGALAVPVGDAHHARIRVEAFGARHAARAFVPDTVLPADEARLFAAVAELAADSARLRRAPVLPPLSPRPVDAITSGFQPLPSLPERVFIVTQLWGLARFGFAYAPLADRPLDDVARDAIREAGIADSPRTWAAALARFIAGLDASNARLQTAVHPEYGQSVGVPPFRVVLLGDRALVVAADSTREAPRPGDELLALGGELIDKRLARWRPLLGASNDWARARAAESWLNSGPAGSTVTARVRAADGAERELQVTYVAPSGDAPPPLRWRGETTRVDTLADGIVRIGADAAVLGPVGSNTTAEATWRALRASARGLVFDLRGARVARTARLLAPDLAGASVTYARDVRTPWTVAASTGDVAAPWDTLRRTVVRERVGQPRDTVGFDGPVAILVDAGTTDEAEVVAASLRRTGGRRVLVGGSTAGAVGAIELARLWGSLLVQLPVAATTGADGRVWQRVGLAPDVFAEPTVEGVRAGRDEVLEAAVRWIEAQLAPPPPRRRR